MDDRVLRFTQLGGSYLYVRACAVTLVFLDSTNTVTLIVAGCWQRVVESMEQVLTALGWEYTPVPTEEK